MGQGPGIKKDNTYPCVPWLLWGGGQEAESLLPSVARIPQAAHMMRQGPTVPVLLSTDLGEMKIPEPMMVPTIMQMPLNRPTWDEEKEEELMLSLMGPEATPNSVPAWVKVDPMFQACPS